MRSKEDIKAMCEEERADAAKIEIKPITDKPTQPGKYTITIENVRSFITMTLNFDGANWVDLDSILCDCQDISKISYFDKVSPELKTPTFGKRKP